MKNNRAAKRVFLYLALPQERSTVDPEKVLVEKHCFYSLHTKAQPVLCLDIKGNADRENTVLSLKVSICFVSHGWKMDTYLRLIFSESL